MPEGTISETKAKLPIPIDTPDEAVKTPIKKLPPTLNGGTVFKAAQSTKADVEKPVRKGIPNKRKKAEEDDTESAEDPLGEDQKISVHGYEMKVEDNFLNRGVTEVHIWALDQKSNPYLLRVRDFPIFCHLELPQFIGGKKYKWDKNSSTTITNFLVSALKEDAPTHSSFGMKRKLYHYRQGQTFPMLLLAFKSLEAMNHCKNLVNKPRYIKGIGNLRFDIWEDSISCIRKMFTMQKCRFAQWFDITGKEVPFDHGLRVATKGTDQFPLREFIVSWRSLTPLPPEVTKDWTTQPRMLAFDIECYSDNHRAMPNKRYAPHVAYMISCIYKRIGDPGSRKKYAIIVGDCNEIEGATVIRVKTEIEMIKAMADLTLELDPEIITGYNIMGFDYPYLDARLGLRMKDWPMMGRIQGKPARMKSKTWASSGYGHNTINDLQIDGRISIDMLPIIRRDYKLDKYDLDTVARKFLKKGKHDIKAPEMFRIYERLAKAQDNFEKMKDATNKIRKAAAAELERAEQAKAAALKKVNDRVIEAGAELEAAISSKDQKRINAATKELEAAKDEMTRVMVYCIQDAELCIDLMEKLNVWIGLIELSSIVGVTITELFTRGQQIRCQSQIFDLAFKLGFVLDKRNAAKMFFNGGFVFEPKPGLYENIICFDFASLYPSIMEAYNICFTTLVPPELMDVIPDEECHVIDIEQEEPIDGKPKSRRGGGDDIPDGHDSDGDDDSEEGEGDEKKPEKKTVTRKYKFKFVKPEIHKGILPQLVHNLVAERNAVKKQMKPIDKEMKGLEKLLEHLKTLSKEDLEKKVRPEFENLQTQIDAKEKPDKKTLKDLTERYELLKCWINAFDTASKDENFIECVRKQYAYLNMQYVVLDKRQGALKISANSMFGFLGAQEGGLMPLIEGAMTITFLGRQLIGKVNDYLITKYGASIVYNDTDSSMASFPQIKERKDCNKWGFKLMGEINGVPEKKLDDGTIVPAVKGLFLSPLKVEFEKAMRLLCIRKKKYAYYGIDEDGSFIKDEKGEIIINKKGIVLARRDNCEYLRSTYLAILKTVMDRESMDVAFETLVNRLTSLLRGEIKPKGRLTIIRGLGKSYKNNNYFMKVFSDELRRMGKPVNPGDRLEYVVVKTQEEKNGQKMPLGKKMRAIEMWEDSQEVAKAAKKKSKFKVVNAPPSPTADSVYPPEDIDYVYYIEHLFMNSIDQLFEVGYFQNLPQYSMIGFKPEHSRCHFASIQTPVKMIAKIINDQMKAYAGYDNTDEEKFAAIADQLEERPKWFKEARQREDDRLKAEVEAAAAAAKAAKPKLKLVIKSKEKLPVPVA